MDKLSEDIIRAAAIIKNAKRAAAFTGAGISVESGIPPFRGEGGLWDRYDPAMLDIGYFMEHPAESWTVIKEIFYDKLDEAKLALGGSNFRPDLPLHYTVINPWQREKAW